MHIVGVVWSCWLYVLYLRATMELQIKTAMQMRDQGHALKQKALDLVTEAEQKAREEERRAEMTREASNRCRHCDKMTIWIVDQALSFDSNVPVVPNLP